MDRQSIGPLASLPTDHCVTVAEGRAVAVRTEQSVQVFENRCPHEGQPLAGGWVAGCVLICPAHFWRFDAVTGVAIGATTGLRRWSAEVVDGEVLVDVPDPEPEVPIRQRLLEHARDWSRDDPIERS